jgi:hypothetical protein
MTDRRKGGANRGKIVSEAEFRRLWADINISQTAIGQMLGISGPAVKFRAKSRGLPPRPRKRPWLRTIDRQRIITLYKSGLSLRAIWRMTGHATSGVKAILHEERVQMRPSGSRAPIQINTIGPAIMAARAREEQAALRLAEMVDGFHQATSGKRRAA